MSNRRLIRALLVLAFAASLTSVVIVIRFPTLYRPEVIAVLAAALAVIPAVLATWSGQRMVELEEDSRVAFPYPTFDARSRYGILQLRMTNYGNSIARNVYLDWITPLETREGAAPSYLCETAPLPVLLPSESASFFVDGSHDFAKKHGHPDFTGVVHFEDASGHRHSHPFVLSSSKFKESLVFDEESVMTHRELQKVPERLQAIEKALATIGKSLEGLAKEIKPDGPDPPKTGTTELE
jgi:hypothetical protein